MLVRAAALLLAVVTLGCGASDDPTKPPAPPEEPCALGAWPAADGGCIAAGLPPDLACPPGSGLDDSGACVGAGVAPDGCGAGFVHDGDIACDAILPAAPCPPGKIAVPGDSACRDVAPCGSAPWGDIPVEANTQYVDLSYAGNASNGSAADPWTTIQQGVDAAAPGAIVAIATGSYAEDVSIAGKAVRLWGRCPSLVEIVGSDQALAAVFVGANASDTTLAWFAVTGDAVGVLLSGSEGVVVDRLWVHDTPTLGIDAEGSLGPTSVTVQSTLVEGATEYGIVALGAELVVEQVAVRDTSASLSSAYSAAIAAESYLLEGGPFTFVTVRGSLLERSQAGVFVRGSEVTIEDVVVRDSTGSGRGGGVILQVPCFDCGAFRPVATVRRSVIENVVSSGVFVLGGDLEMEDVVVRDVALDAQEHAEGITMSIPCGTDGVQTFCNASLRATATLRSSTVARVSGRGINVRGSDATIDRVALLDSPTLSTVQRFPGISVEAVCIDDDGGSTCDPATRASAVLTSSLVDRGQGVGVVVGGADATIKQVLVRDTFPNMDGLFGRGVQIQDQCGVYECEPPLPAHADIWATVVEGSTETGVAIISSTGVLEASEVRDTVASQFGFYGDGVVVFALTAPAAATLMSTRVAESARAGLASFGAQVALGGNAFVCHAFALNGELYNDQPYAFEDLGHNGCGCPDPDEPCKAVSSNLAPPPALEPAPSTGP